MKLVIVGGEVRRQVEVRLYRTLNVNSICHFLYYMFVLLTAVSIEP